VGHIKPKCQKLKADKANGTYEPKGKEDKGKGEGGEQAHVALVVGSTRARGIWCVD
jgi:hypothetical protein